MHIVTNNFGKDLKHRIKEELKEHGINHSTIEFESTDENCNDEECEINNGQIKSHSHHHHH